MHLYFVLISNKTNQKNKQQINCSHSGYLLALLVLNTKRQKKGGGVVKGFLLVTRSRSLF